MWRVLVEWKRQYQKHSKYLYNTARYFSCYLRQASNVGQPGIFAGLEQRPGQEVSVVIRLFRAILYPSKLRNAEQIFMGFYITDVE
jgi:hypothetical protein